MEAAHVIFHYFPAYLSICRLSNVWLVISRIPSLHINLSGPDHSSYALQIISLDVELALWLPLLWFYNYSVLIDCHSLLICLSHLVLEL